MGGRHAAIRFLVTSLVLVVLLLAFRPRGRWSNGSIVFVGVLVGSLTDSYLQRMR